MDDIVVKIARGLKERDWLLACAESCTGGLLAARYTNAPGASSFFERGFVTYSNQAKIELLTVPPALIDEHGAVSAEVAEAMAKGVLESSRAGIAISITGIAGPDGGSKDKPVGLVYIGVATWEKVKVHKHLFKGDRGRVREQAVEASLEHVLKALA